MGDGDGVYKSVDGGRRWRRMGLEASEHTGLEERSEAAGAPWTPGRVPLPSAAPSEARD